MPLSTSNSDKRAAKCLREGRWSKLWFVVVIITVLSLLSWEVAWRLAGFEPSITDDWPLWSRIRRQTDDAAEAVALVGSSRILLGLDPTVLKEQFKQKSFHMLAIDGSNPLPVLENLAADPNFIGNVICSLSPYWLAGSRSSSEDRVMKWLRKYRTQPLSSRLENVLVTFVQSHLSFRSSVLAPQHIWSKWYADEAIVPPYAPMRPDRYRPADFSGADLPTLRVSREQRSLQLYQQAEPLSPGQFRQRIARIERAVEKITSRGGKVAFVRFPSCGRVRHIEEKFIPRKRYWDVFASGISALTFHFADYPQLSQSQCADGSHLGHDDAVHFTRALTGLLLSRGFFK